MVCEVNNCPCWSKHTFDDFAEFLRKVKKIRDFERKREESNLNRSLNNSGMGFDTSEDDE